MSDIAAVVTPIVESIVEPIVAEVVHEVVVKVTAKEAELLKTVIGDIESIEVWLKNEIASFIQNIKS